MGEEDQRLSFDMWQLVLRNCMAKKGFTFVAKPSWTDYDPSAIPTAEQVLDRGYHEPDPPPSPGNDARAAADPAFAAALFGNDDAGTNGCTGSPDTKRALGTTSGYAKLDRSVSDALSAANDRVEASARYRSLNEAWATCMAGKGYKYNEPADPLAQYAQAGSITKAEVATRIADQNCQAKVSYVRTVSVLRNAEIAPWVEEHPQLLKDLAEAKDRFLRDLAELRASTR